MQIGSLDPAVGGHGAVAMPIERCKRANAIGAGCHAHMDFVAAHIRLIGSRSAAAPDDGLVFRHRRLNVQQAQTLRACGAAVRACRIDDAASQHLVSAAQSEDPRTGARLGLNVDVPTLRAQHRQVAERGFRAGQDDRIRVHRDGFAWRNERDGHAGLRAQRIEVVEIRDMREHGDGDEEVASGCARGFSLQRNGVLFRQTACRRQPWNDAQRRPARMRRDGLRSSRKQRWIAAKFVDEEAADARAVGGR